MSQTPVIHKADQQVAPSAGDKILHDRQRLIEAKQAGEGAKWKTYMRLSGPGWLQSAITLGGGSLAGSLYLGVIGGYQMMWLQPLMMILGIIMLSAIAYVTLSTGQRPFDAINNHVSPVLGWGWLIASLMANLVWAMPQFALGTAALEQNLLPGIFGGTAGNWLAVAMLFVIASVIVWFYDSGGWGVKVFELILKVMVAIVVLSFFGVVAVMTIKGSLPWGQILAGFVPDLSLLWKPADQLQQFIAASGAPEYWEAAILSTQRDRMVTAAATAVGINMTFLLPYSMLRKGWDREFRGLATFDLSTGLFIPFVLATSCVMIASASQFHGQFDEQLVSRPAVEATGSYRAQLESLIQSQVGHEVFAEMPAASVNEHVDALGPGDKQLAAMLVERDAFELAGSLEHLTGKGVAQYVFGIGVVGMAISTIIILMLINGFCLTEMLGRPGDRTLHRIGAILPGITGALGFLLLWSQSGEARFWLAVPTSVFGMVLLPIAYVTFFLMINNKALLGDQYPRGDKRTYLNAAMLIAIIAASIGAGWSIWSKTRWLGVGAAAAFILLVLLVHVLRPRSTGGGGRSDDVVSH